MNILIITYCIGMHPSEPLTTVFDIRIIISPGIRQTLLAANFRNYDDSLLHNDYKSGQENMQKMSYFLRFSGPGLNFSLVSFVT